MGDAEVRLVALAATDTMDRDETAEAMLERVYDQYAQPLYRYAFAVTGSREDAEDAVQEVFVRLARSARKLPKVADLKAYLFSSTRNAAYDVLRARQRGGRLSEALQSDLAISADHDAAACPGDTALCEALGRLPVDQREVLVLKVFDEMTFQEIAAVLGISINTAASRYRYAVAKLREALEASNGTSP